MGKTKRKSRHKKVDTRFHIAHIAFHCPTLLPSETLHDDTSNVLSIVPAKTAIRALNARIEPQRGRCHRWCHSEIHAVERKKHPLPLRCHCATIACCRNGVSVCLIWASQIPEASKTQSVLQIPTRLAPPLKPLNIFVKQFLAILLTLPCRPVRSCLRFFLFRLNCFRLSFHPFQFHTHPFKLLLHIVRVRLSGFHSALLFWHSSDMFMAARPSTTFKRKQKLQRTMKHTIIQNSEWSNPEDYGCRKCTQ